jgi:hypothetical protein
MIRVMSCHVMSCHVMSRHVMSCHAISCNDRHEVRVWLVLLIRNGTSAHSDTCFMVCLYTEFLGLTCVHQDGMTALMWAVKGKCRRSVERLLDGGAITEIRDKVYNIMSCHVT